MSAYVWQPEITSPGIRLAVKDNIAVAGLPTRAGGTTPIVANEIQTAPVVQTLLDAGYALVGKTKMVELAFGGWGTNATADAPGNPWDSSRVCGGSSSGSAAAVADGTADVALGTDTGGSVRIPAALCGVCGYKPRRAAIPVEGVVPLAPSLDTVGIFARDVAGVQAAIAHFAPVPDARPPSTVAVWSSGDVEPAIATAMTIATGWLNAAGVESRSLHPMPNYLARSQPMLAYEAWQTWHAHLRRHRATMDADVVAKLDKAAATTDTEYRSALADRDRDCAQDAAEWPADVLMLPTVPMVAPRFSEVDGESTDIARFTRMANWIDLAAMSLPVGLSETGLPVAVQLVARSGAEPALFALARLLEAVRGPLTRPGENR